MTSLSGTGPTILQIIPRLDGGGAEATTLEITRALTAAGGKSIIATEGGALEAEIAAAGGEIVHLPVASKNPLTIWRNINRLAGLARQKNVDILHARSRAPAWSAYAAARRLSLPYIATYHSKVHARPWLKVKYNAIMTRGELVIANSHYTAAQIAAVHHMPTARIRVIPRGCDPARFDPALFDPALPDGKAVAALRQSWATANTQDPQAQDFARDFVIVCPARLTRWKGQMVLLESVAQLPVQPVLVLTGDTDANPDYVTSLRSFATQAGLEKLIFAGHVANMPQVLAAADLAVLPSLEPEPFGRTAIEAQAAARVVIASDEGGFRETVLAIKDSPEESADVSAKESAKESAEEIEVATGLRVPPNDPTALADAIHQVMSMTAEQRAAMGMRGRARVMAQFTTARLCSETLNIYHELIGG